MEIWQRGAAISGPLFRLADGLEQKRMHRFAEQLRAAVLSITNNIAEGSGSTSAAEFANFLNIARRSVFEVANMLRLFFRRAFVLRRKSVRTLLSLTSKAECCWPFVAL